MLPNWTKFSLHIAEGAIKNENARAQIFFRILAQFTKKKGNKQGLKSLLDERFAVSVENLAINSVLF
jgi:hypothetical protein